MKKAEEYTETELRQIARDLRDVGFDLAEDMHKWYRSWFQDNHPTMDAREGFTVTMSACVTVIAGLCKAHIHPAKHEEFIDHTVRGVLLRIQQAEWSDDVEKN